MPPDAQARLSQLQALHSRPTSDVEQEQRGHVGVPAERTDSFGSADVELCPVPTAARAPRLAN